MADYKIPILETSYLSVPGVAHYRTIMRKMFIEDERMHNGLYKEEIMKLVKEDEEFSSYTMDELKQDLDQLVTWNNLVAVQDPGIVHTIAEYKNKQYRYSMSERAIEIERLTIKLENLNIESASLSTNYFLRIQEALDEAQTVKMKSLQETNEWWHMFLEDFQRLTQNYKDYLREFYGADTKALLQSMEFIMHKERFINYLNNFIRQMQLQSRKIRIKIEKIDELFQTELIDKIIKSEQDIPHLEKKNITEEELKELTQNRWISFKRWFLSIDGQKPECEKILDITNEIIRSVIDNANIISQLNNFGVSRKDDYKHFIKLFSQYESLDDAHCLSAHIFGIQKIEHFKTNSYFDTEKTRLSAYDKEENIVELESHSRTYKERRKKEGIQDQSLNKMMARQEYENNIKKKEKMINQYIKGNHLNIFDIQECIPEEFRTSLLTWISNANMSKSKEGNTEYGRKFRLIQEEGECVLHCEDGDITMPRYILEFEDERN